MKCFVSSNTWPPASRICPCLSDFFGPKQIKTNKLKGESQISVAIQCTRLKQFNHRNQTSKIHKKKKL